MTDEPPEVDRLPDDVWETVVSNAPIPSVDLVVRSGDGVVLARRTNEPAKGEWFVPGGRIRKGETLREAVHRVARIELGVDVTVERELGAYDHLYEASDVADSGGKHYVAHGYVVTPDAAEFELDAQHDDVRVFAPEDLPSLHEYVEAYLVDAGILRPE
ncbi:GDP-mannose mannosyl hydrolase [Halobaculum lipolyticum]|uniref:GDP-mannose mannosyl hydrolase n=1 Tax=Halobaculum lipolyticum TaxID=3032001 RepID=A0ABD5WFS4_9EURY|nr:NUDIX domain-containing protein [Halobaculum sp. DT31]